MEVTREQHDVIEQMADRCDSVAVRVAANGTASARALVGVRTVFAVRISPDGTTERTA